MIVISESRIERFIRRLQASEWLRAILIAALLGPVLALWLIVVLL